MAVAGLTVVALVLRAGPLGPHSLWLDDAWVALVHRTGGLDEVRALGFAAPGFVVVLRLWLDLVGFSETAAQALPMVAGAAGPASAYLLARRLGWQRASALLGGVVLVASPVAIDYASRVKQYTVETLLGVALLALAAHLLDDPGDLRRWARVVVGGVGAMVVSAPLAVYVVAAVVAGLVRGRRDRDRTVTRLALAAGTAFGAVAAAWYGLVLAPTVGTTLATFWSGRHLVLDEGARRALESIGAAATGVAGGLAALPAAGVVASVLVALAAVARRRPDLGALLATPLAVALVLAALERAPLGGGRTDSYLYPTFALALAGGADRLVAALPRWGPAAVVVASSALVLAAPSAAPYPAQDVRSLVAALDQRREPGEALVVYPATMWAYALYTGDEVSVGPSPASSWGFAPRFADDATFVLPPGRADPSSYAPAVALVAARPGAVWLLASHWAADYAALQAQLVAAGLERVEAVASDGAELTRWRRR